MAYGSQEFALGPGIFFRPLFQLDDFFDHGAVGAHIAQDYYLTQKPFFRPDGLPGQV
jgi:hypothetical protein